MIERVDRWRWQQAILSKNGPDGPLLRLLLAVNTHMDGRGENAWPSRNTIAERSGASR